MLASSENSYFQRGRKQSRVEQILPYEDECFTEAQAAHYNFNTALGDICALVCCFVVFFLLCSSAHDGFLNNGGAHIHKHTAE